MGYIGIIFALGALLFWGFGDFFIQRTSRRTGIIPALFYITGAASLVLAPFIWKDLIAITAEQMWMLFGAGLVIFIVALLEFEAFKIGKLAVVEPIMSLELPLTVLIAAGVGHEQLNFWQYVIIGVVFIGIFLTVTPHTHVLKDYLKKLEKGTLLAFVSAGGMALFNFLLGHASQQTTPLLAQWSTSLVMAIGCLIYLAGTGQIQSLFANFKKAPGLVVAETIFDNFAWISFAFAAIYIPISVAITVSESYIILAVILGIIFNREKLKHHQFLGVVLAVGGVIILAYFTAT